MRANSRYRYAFAITLLASLLVFISACRSTSVTEVEAETLRRATASQTVTSTETGTVSESSAVAADQAQEPESANEPVSDVAPIEISQLLELILRNQGFFQSDDRLAFGFEVENPNGIAVSDSSYAIQAYDASGLLAGTDAGRIPLMLPDQRLGIAGSMQLENRLDVESIRIQIATGGGVTVPALPDLAVLSVNYRPSKIYNRASGLIENRGSQDLEDIRVSALAYDADRQIIGSGYAFLSFLPSGATAGIDITMNTAEVVSQIDLYPRASLADLLNAAPVQSPPAAGIEVLGWGYSQNGVEVGYGFLLENPNPYYNFVDIEYRVTLTNESKLVIAVDAGYIDRLAPRHQFGIGDHLFVDDGETVGAMMVQARPVQLQTTIPEPILVSAEVEVITSTVDTFVRALVLNPRQEAAKNVRVTALVYDDNHRIIGGGFDWVESIPAGGSTPVEIWVAVADTVADAEVYANEAEIIREFMSR